jgi:hypothetical protein
VTSERSFNPGTKKAVGDGEACPEKEKQLSPKTKNLPEEHSLNRQISFSD